MLGTYATLFPERVNLMVLDGNDDADVDITQNAEDIAKSMHQRITYFVSVCSEETFNTDGPATKCGIDDPSGCITGLGQFIKENYADFDVLFTNEYSKSEVVRMVLKQLYSLVGQPDEYDNLCGIPKSAYAVEDFQALPMFETTDEIVADDDNCGEESKSQPTRDCVYNFPEYNDIISMGAIPQNLVTAQVSSLCISCVSNYHKP